MKKLKLFVWENVLRDYTAGMVVILAKDLDDALKVFRKKFPNDDYIIEAFAGYPYKIITEPDAFYIYGGG